MAGRWPSATATGVIFVGFTKALNESFSDVFGSLVKQYTNHQTVDDADWLIGQGILGPDIQGQALRSMK
jgi:Zn-dependent metalloprotease